MGRGKIEIKRIENSNNRHVTYSKRRNGIMKKANEIAVLCDAKVSLVIFGASGKMHDYCSPNTSVVDILNSYHNQSEERLWDAKHENLSNEIARVKKENENLQIQLRHLRGEDITSLTHQDLQPMEEALDHGMNAARQRQMEIWETHKRNGKMLEEENRELGYVYQQKQQMVMEGKMRGMESSYVMAEGKDYQQQQQQMPFGFKLQPNLEERI